MAHMYKVSADTSEKEKVIGGVLTLVQGMWLAIGFVITGVIFVLFHTFLPSALALILGLIPGLAVGLSFAFYQKEGLPLLTYLLYKRAFGKKNKKLINDMLSQKDSDEQFVLKN